MHKNKKQHAPDSEISAMDDIYGEHAIWLCENRKTRFKTRIQGSLAQILKQYPADYSLQLLKIKEKSHEHGSGTDQ